MSQFRFNKFVRNPEAANLHKQECAVVKMFYKFPAHLLFATLSVCFETNETNFELPSDFEASERPDRIYHSLSNGIACTWCCPVTAVLRLRCGASASMPLSIGLPRTRVLRIRSATQFALELEMREHGITHVLCCLGSEHEYHKDAIQYHSQLERRLRHLVAPARRCAMD
jgi:hypothetical protein